MNFEPTEEQKAILDVVRRFVRKEIRPLEQDLDYDADELPPEHLDRLTAMTHAMGLHGLGTPRGVRWTGYRPGDAHPHGSRDVSASSRLVRTVLRGIRRP